MEQSKNITAAEKKKPTQTIKDFCSKSPRNYYIDQCTQHSKYLCTVTVWTGQELCFYLNVHCWHLKRRGEKEGIGSTAAEMAVEEGSRESFLYTDISMAGSCQALKCALVWGFLKKLFWWFQKLPSFLVSI